MPLSKGMLLAQIAGRSIHVGQNVQMHKENRTAPGQPHVQNDRATMMAQIMKSVVVNNLMPEKSFSERKASIKCGSNEDDDGKVGMSTCRFQ